MARLSQDGIGARGNAVRLLAERISRMRQRPPQMTEQPPADNATTELHAQGLIRLVGYRLPKLAKTKIEVPEVP